MSQFREIRRQQNIQESAYFEYISIPADRSFLWRMDDYPWRRCVWNYHPEFEIHLIRHSSGLAYIGDHIGNFDAGQLVLVGSNLPHNWITPSIGNQKLLDRDIVVQFDPEPFQRAAGCFPEFVRTAPLFERAALGLEFTGKMAERGAALLEAMGRAGSLSQLSYLIELLALMAESPDYRTLASPQFVDRFRLGSSSELEALEKALDYIQLNYLSKPRLGDVAEISGMSESTFSRFFKNHTGNTFSDHISTLRIWTARKLLSDSAIPITDICYESGFNNISNFNRTFMKHTGMTPSQYRRASRIRSLPTVIPTAEAAAHSRKTGGSKDR